MRLKVTTDKRAWAKADVLVCVPVTTPLVLPDNKIGDCSACGQRIQYRPYAPRKVRRVCTVCCQQMIEEQIRQGTAVEMITTPTAISEAVAELKKDTQ